MTVGGDKELELDPHSNEKPLWHIKVWVDVHWKKELWQRSEGNDGKDGHHPKTTKLTMAQITEMRYVKF